jgi:signal transduction histidine kinase
VVGRHGGRRGRADHQVEDLRASRQRLVTAQDEERRRLERNLHDGAQQDLVALAIKLRLASAVVEEDTAEARQLLGELQEDAAGALSNLRDLARGIYPPLLADRGLVPALRAQADKSPVPVVVDADGIGRFGQNIEARRIPDAARPPAELVGSRLDVGGPG